MRRSAFPLVAALLGVLISLPAQAQEEAFTQEGVYLGGPPPGARPLEVRMGFSLTNITDVDEREETIDFDGSLYLMWMDPRLAHDPASVGLDGWVAGDYSSVPRRLLQGDFRVKEIYEGWRPHLVIPNGIGDRTITNIALGVWPDGMVVYTETFQARVEAPMNLRRFPFDRQRLEVFIQPFVYGRDEVVLVPDDRLSDTWDQDMGIAQWRREGISMLEQSTQSIRRDGSSRSRSEYVVTVDITRRPGHVLISIVLPLIVLVSLTWVVFWMDDESIANRVSISFVGILSVVAYYFVIVDSVPEISYLTLMDAFILVTFFVLAASVGVNLLVDRLNRSGRRELGDRVDQVCRWGFPIGYALLTLLVLVIFFNLE